jgi:hypothetical protein
MAGAASESLPLNTSILLTVTGVSKCIEVEAHAALTVAPLALGGVGIALAFDLPVHVKACGLGTLGLSENVEVSVWGPGLSFSDPFLAEGLKSIGFEAYDSEQLTVHSIRDSLSGREGLEAVLASVEGSLMVTVEALKPLENLVNSTAVIVKLRSPLPDTPWRLAELAGLTAPSLYLSLVDTDRLLEELTRIAEAILPKDIYRTVCRGYACAVDYTGNYVVSIHDESDQDIARAGEEAARYGDVVIADVIVPPI